ncbi:MAG: carbohydrate ABC transporter permease [Acidimicrobiales bacterium]|jgi:ABC-type sugar transport system permease subunit
MRLVKIMKKNMMEVAFILPLLIFIAYINIYPIIEGVILGFTRLGKFTLSNYHVLQTQYTPPVSVATTNLLLYVPLALFIEFALALFTALLLNRSFRGRSVFRAIIILPYGVATVVSAIAFTFVFSPTGWYANEFIIKLGLVHTDINWTVGVLGFLSVAIADSWKTFPLIMLILLGGLQMIPDNLYEAAAVDGASQIQQFRHITLPNLYPFIMIALIIRAVSEFNILALPLILVGRNVVFLGTMSYSIYETFSVGSSELSASAATILLGIILVFVIVYVYISNRMVGDQSAE